MLKLRGLATGIGSLPYKNTQEALDVIFKYLPQIPFWPQLPQRDKREGMVIQYSEGMPFLELKENSLVLVAEGSLDSKMEEFYANLISENLDYFKISRDYAAGFDAFSRQIKKENLAKSRFLKLHITGPFSFAAGLKDNKGVSLLHNPVIFQAIQKCLAMKAIWQMELLKDLGRDFIIFIDEPYLGCFGSAYTPISREMVINCLSELIGSIKQKEKALVGIHCCGNTDWSIFTDTKGVDIINFDAYSFMERVIAYAADLKAFFERGGILCWGIVPTQEFSGKENPKVLIDKINAGIDSLVNKGLDQALIRDNFLLSPACGLGSLNQDLTPKILSLLAEISSIFSS